MPAITRGTRLQYKDGLLHRIWKGKGRSRKDGYHKALERTVAELLQEQGCWNIEREVCITDERDTLVPDVIADSTEGLIAIECGGITDLRGRRRRLTIYNRWLTEGKLHKLLILPRGERVPFEWKEGIEVCPTCGHMIEE